MTCGTDPPSKEPTREPTTSSPTFAPPTADPTAEPTVSGSNSAGTDSPTTAAPITAAPTTAAPTQAVPTVQPTLAPTFEVCQENDTLNIGFLMDESGSVESAEWDVMVEFVSRIATYDLAGQSYVALWEFASLVAFDQFLDFTKIEDDRDGVTTVTTALESNNYNSAGTTETWDAVNRFVNTPFCSDIWCNRISEMFLSQKCLDSWCKC